MRNIELAGQLRQQVAEVTLVADAGQQAAIGGHVAVPVHPVHVGPVEFVPGEAGDLVEGGGHPILPAGGDQQSEGVAAGLAGAGIDEGYFPLSHQGGEAGILVEAGQRRPRLLGKQQLGLALAQIPGVALDLALAVGPAGLHQIDQVIVDDATGENGAFWLQLQRLPVCQPVGFEAVASLGRRLFGKEIASGGAAAVEAEQAAAEGLSIGAQHAVLGGLPIENAAILTPGRLTIPIAVEADVDRLGLGIPGVDDGDLLLGGVGLDGQRQVTRIGGKGQLHRVAGGVELGSDQLALLAAGQIQQMDGLAVHHEGELFAIGGEGRHADGGARDGQQFLLGQGAGVAEQLVRLPLLEAVQRRRPLLLGEVDELLLFIQIARRRLLAGVAGELAYPLAAGVDRVEIPLADQDHLFPVLAGDGLVDGAGLPALLGRHLGEQRLDAEFARGVAAGIEAVELPLPGPDQIPLAGGREAAHRVAFEVGELAILAAGQIPLPDVEIAAALAQVVELLALLVPDRIAGGHPVFGQLAMLFAVEQPQTGDGERVLVLAKRLIHARHLVGQLVAVGAGQGGGQGLGRSQRAAGNRRPVEVAGLVAFRHEVIGVGVGQALAAQQQFLAVGAEGLGQIGARIAGQPHHLAAAARHHEHVFVAVEVGGKGDQRAIR